MNGKLFVIVDNIKFIVLMIKWFIKIWFLVIVSLKILERIDILELLEFFMDFMNVNWFFIIVLRFIVKVFFGLFILRRWRLVREDFILFSGGGFYKMRLLLW